MNENGEFGISRSRLGGETPGLEGRVDLDEALWCLPVPPAWPA